MRDDQGLPGLLRVGRAAAGCAVAVLAVAVLLDSCAGEAPSAEGDAPRPGMATPEAGAPDLDALRALGYTTWDPAPSGAGGVRVHDRESAWDGVQLWADDVDRALAVDMDGTPLHAWQVPGRDQVEFFRLLPDSPEGGILALSVDQGLTRLDARGALLWSLDLAAHHEIAVLADGSFAVPVWEEREYRGRRVRFDHIAFVSAAGEVTAHWSTHAHLGELQALHPPLALDTAEPPMDPPTEDEAEDEEETVYDYYHLNSIAPLGANALDQDPRFAPDNLLVCFRNANLLVILDRDDLSVCWHWRPGTLDFPHMPRMLANGRILLFDNGAHRGWSRVLELDPLSGEVPWSWCADPPEDFFTRLRGSVQRLSNGNTLICESQRRRAFEVTPAGEVVWEFLNPDVVDGRRRRIYRVVRVPRSDLTRALGR